MKKSLLTIFGLMVLLCLPTSAQELNLKGIGHGNRHDDGEQMTTEYLGWNSQLQKAIFLVENGIYKMSWDGIELTAPTRDPKVIKSEVLSSDEKALWANNFNLMYGNSGAVYVDGLLVTVMSRDEQSTVDEELFNVRLWDAKTGNMLATYTLPKNMFLESAGMSYNPKDGNDRISHLTQLAFSRILSR